jgi:hypothetical protein
MVRAILTHAACTCDAASSRGKRAAVQEENGLVIFGWALGCLLVSFLLSLLRMEKRWIRWQQNERVGHILQSTVGDPTPPPLSFRPHEEDELFILAPQPPYLNYTLTRLVTKLHLTLPSRSCRTAYEPTRP